MNILDDDDQQQQQQQVKSPTKLSKSLSFRSVASDSTASTVQSAYVTPSVTPAASFNAADNLPKPRFNLDEPPFGDQWNQEDTTTLDDADFTFEDLLTSADKELINNNNSALGSFDILSSLLDPFEQLEKEFESSPSGERKQLSDEIERQLPQLLDKSKMRIDDDICDCQDVICDDVDCFFEERCQQLEEVSLTLDKIR